MRYNKNFIEEGDYINEDGISPLGPSKGKELLHNLILNIAQNIRILDRFNLPEATSYADTYLDKFSNLEQEVMQREEYKKSVILTSPSFFQKLKGAKDKTLQEKVRELESLDRDSFEKLNKLNNDIISTLNKFGLNLKTGNIIYNEQNDESDESWSRRKKKSSKPKPKRKPVKKIVKKVVKKCKCKK
jgi:hypothetical protein